MIRVMNATTKMITQPFMLPVTYLRASVFVILSVLTPVVMHQFSISGVVFLPILFFTFFAAIRYGWAVGLLSAIASPLVSNMLTGMPPGIILYVVLAQCVVISLLAGAFMQNKFKISFLQILAIIIAYQATAVIIESFAFGFTDALHGFTTTIPGMLIQLFFFTLYSKYLTSRT
ncbi:MAG: hypothetical protein ACRCX4_13960 [Bacteroidales bacterium]